ncbi:FAD dependent oxidoreductase [Lophiotrema nucula]|uniref:FAD dependent oxidoreductase n=1 Tax=Lophiotrema nucula TaxID=690887 RepID=A0A6A5YI31_9PLEO|nr:FAD dependent oxidoreductase [Lophiotrema nucula]
MTQAIPASLLGSIHAQMIDDPQLPRDNPTTSFWQIPPHPNLSKIQSAELPQRTEYAIIGSGVTGCSIAKNLLELSPSGYVTVFEARLLCSGATGRNGGLLTSFVPSDFTTLSEHLGVEQAVKIARFANRTLDKMHELGNASKEFKSASEVRRVRDVVCFGDAESFQAGKKSMALYEEHVPEDRGTFEVLSAKEARLKYNVKESFGAIIFNCGAFWPYRLITAIWAQLRSQHSTRLSIETKTPITAISIDSQSDSKYPYVLTTPRGTVRAAQVIHATNGYTGHLLPKLRGAIFPVRGTMSTQKPPAAFGNFGNERAWSFTHRPRFDSETNVLELGLYYSNQNPKSGDVFIGGESARLDEIFAADDTTISVPSKDNISSIMTKLFTYEEPAEVRKVWSGIMGFTADHMPLVGKVPASITGRGDGEWIAAGFNGYGMPQCWSSGEAVAKMILGIDASDFLPDVFLATEERLGNAERMDPKAFLGRLLGL